jgi:hypothetical protein
LLRGPRAASLGLLAAWLFDAVAYGQAPPPVEVLTNDLDVAFADGLDFALRVEAPSRVVDATLRYRVGSDQTIQRRAGRIEPSAMPGTASVAYREDLVRGQIAPASEISWWWTLEHADGAETTTMPRSALYLDEERGWRSESSGPVRVWYYGQDDGLAERVLEAAVTGLDNAEATLGYRPDRTVQVVTYRSREDMLPALVGRGDAYEQRIATLGARVAPDIVLVLAEPGQRDLEEVLAHELSHVALHLRAEEAYVNAPLWLDEGLAMRNESDALSASDQAILDAAIERDALMSVQSLSSFPGRAELVPLAYAQSHDMVSYLIARDGLPTFQTYLDRLGSGDMTAAEAMTSTYGIDELALYQEYRAARGLEPATMDRPVAAPGRAAGPCASALLLPVLAFGVAYASSSRRRR